MSATSTLVTEAHFRYVAAHTRQDDAFLRDLKAAARTAGFPAIWIAPEQASLMQVLLRLARATEVVEVGALAGYSAISMARALPPQGRVRTIDVDPRSKEFVDAWVARSDVRGKVVHHLGRGVDVLAGFAAASADAAFLDADKESYPAYLRECLRIVRPGGLVMVDNAFAFGGLLDPDEHDSSVEAIRAFNDLMAAQPGLQGVIVPIGDGLWVATRTG